MVQTIYINPNTGNLGIGTATPLTPLHIQGDSIISGNVGIGTTNPQSTLHINGPLRVGNASMSAYTTSLPLFACRAFVSFSQAVNVASVTINSSGNVASVSKATSASSLFTITFQEAMPSTNYCVLVTHTADGTGANSGQPLITKYTSYLEITPQRNIDSTNPNREDNPTPTNINVAIFI